MSQGDQPQSKSDWAYSTLEKDVEMNYAAFTGVWKKQGQKGEPPSQNVFYKIKREVKTDQEKERLSKPAESIMAKTAAKAASMEAPTEPASIEAEIEPPPPLAPTSRPRGSRPVATTFTGTPDRRFRENKVEGDEETEAEGKNVNVKKYYEDLELRLDDLLHTADKLRNRQLAETLRHARRLASKELLK